MPPRRRLRDPAISLSVERSVLRRWAKAASTTANTSARVAVVAGGSRRVQATRPESTLGAGQNTSRPTAPARRTSANQAALTEGTPYTLEPGGAASRSATSDCTITSPRSRDGQQGQQVQQHRHGDVVGQVGDQGGRGRAGHGVDAHRVGEDDLAVRRLVRGVRRDRVREQSGEDRVDLDRHDAPGDREQGQGQRAQARPDLDHDVVGR